jgi:hypothetical protein
VKGIKGHLATTKIGTVRWRIQDDNGITHRFDLSGTYYVPELPLRLLSPQHLAREIQQKDSNVDGTVCNTYSDRVTLSWQNCKYTRTIPLNQSNVAIIRSGPSFKGYQAY